MLDNQILEKANQPQDRKTGRNTGGLLFNKGDGSQGYGASVLNLLLSRDGTLIWDMDDERNGLGVFNSIYEYAAAEIYAENATMRERFEAAEQRAHEAQSGFVTLGKWLDEHYDRPLFRLKGRKGNKITIITIDESFVDPATGLTASESQYNKCKEQATGQLTSFTKRARQIKGTAEALQALGEIVGNQTIRLQQHSQQSIEQKAQED